MRNNRNTIIYSLYACRTVGLALQVSFFLLGSAPEGASAENQNAARDWHILCLNGDWRRYSTAMDTKYEEELQNDENVEGDGLIRFLGTLSKDKEKDKDKYIVINYRSDPERLIKRDCSIWNDCSKPIFLPKLANDRRKTTRIEEALAFLKSFATTEETIASMHRMRGIPERKEGVALIVDEDMADFKEVRRYMKKGLYSLTSVEKDLAMNERVFLWDSTNTVVKIKGAKLTPGLYEISPLEDQGIALSILLCAGQQCSEAQVRYRTVESAIEKCEKDDRYNDYLRIYLFELEKAIAMPGH